jgi:hypothetical protein
MNSVPEDVYHSGALHDYIQNCVLPVSQLASKKQCSTKLSCLAHTDTSAVSHEGEDALMTQTTATQQKCSLNECPNRTEKCKSVMSAKPVMDHLQITEPVSIPD